MLRPIDNLRSDHATTAGGLSVLSAVARHIRLGGVFPAEETAVLLRFLREFVVAVHLRKETEFVCPAVAMRGDDRSAQLVGELLRLQDEASDLVHALVMFWEPTGELTEVERQGFADTAETLVSRMLRMQTIEEQQLFPICEQAVPADDQLEWMAAFAGLEAERGSRATWAARVQALAAKWVS